MRRILSALGVVLLLFGCGGGDSGTGAGGGGVSGSPPDDVSGDYTGSWKGSGPGGGGASVICSGEFDLTISQSGTTLAVAFDVVTSTGSSQCDEAFDFSGTGQYLSSTGAISFGAVIGTRTVTITGTVTEQDGRITMSGQWSEIDTASANVIASGTWSARSNS